MSVRIATNPVRPVAEKETGRNRFPSQYWGPRVFRVASSFTAKTTKGRPAPILAHGHNRESPLRICSNCHAVRRPAPSPAL